MTDPVPGTRVLVVDDEPQIIRFLRPSLIASGYDVEVAETGAAALRLAATVAPNIIVLDLGLPDMDGKDVIRSLRAWSQIPIIILSARDRETEKIAALDLGADDYVNKPFAIGELMARLRVAVRHTASGRDGPGSLAKVVSENLEVDPVLHTVTLAGAKLKLTRKEFELLHALMRNSGRVLTHRQLLTAVWGPAHTEDTQYLRVFVGQLRQKIEVDPTHPKRILTEPGIGYRFAAYLD